MTCSKCDRKNDRVPQRYCSRCHAIYMRRWRKAQRTFHMKLLKLAIRHFPETVAREG